MEVHSPGVVYLRDASIAFLLSAISSIGCQDRLIHIRKHNQSVKDLFGDVVTAMTAFLIFYALTSYLSVI